MSHFPLIDGNRSIPSAPGARKAALSVEDVAALVREVSAHLEGEGLTALFQALESDAKADDDPDLGPILSLCGPRVLPTAGLAILPPSLRFNCERADSVYRIFAAGRWINGVNGYALAPSDLRPELSVWAYSEGGLLERGEWGPVADWLAEHVAPLRAYTLDQVDMPDRANLIGNLACQAEELWDAIESDLRSPQPRPDWTWPSAAYGWSGELDEAGRPQGEWTHSRHGVVGRRETYAEGLRHGPLAWWHVTQEPRSDDLNDVMSLDDLYDYRQGHVEREGTFVRGAAHGTFRFFNEAGRLLQEGAYEHGWPHGSWTVHPEATRGLAEPASVEYAQGVPVTWTIPPLAFDSVEVDRDSGERTTLARLASGSRGIVLVDCAETSIHELPDRAVQELTELPDILVLGIHTRTPGLGRLAGRAIEIVADPTQGLARAYRVFSAGLRPLTYLDAEGKLLRASSLKSARFTTLFPSNDTG